MTSAADRRQQILDAIAKAAALAKRDPGGRPAGRRQQGPRRREIEPLIAAGQRDFGENRVQEALAKWPPLLARASRPPPPRDRPPAVEQGGRGGTAVRRDPFARPPVAARCAGQGSGQGRPFPAVYVQVNIGEEEQKGGCPIAEVGELVAAVRASPLPLAGLMAIPPLGLEPAPYFALLAEARAAS